jgi:hypothetical protein
VLRVKEITMDDERDETSIRGRAAAEAARTRGAEAARALADFANAMGNRAQVEAFVEELTRRTHRTLQQSVMRTMVACIEAWAAAKDSDLRNEATIKLCKRIVAATGDTYERHLPHV